MGIKKSFLAVFSLMVFLFSQNTFAQAPTINYPTAAAAITRGFGQSKLTVEIVFNGACTGTNVKISLPNSVTYLAGTVAKTGGTAALSIAESVITDLRTPEFTVSGAIATGNSITFTIDRKAECGVAASGKDSVLVTFSGGCTTGRDTLGTVNTYNILAPALSISANPAISGAVLGDTYTRTHIVTNGGTGGTDTLRFFVVYPSGGIENTAANYAITANSVSFDTVRKSGDTLFYKIYGATIFGGDNVLTSAETVTITEPIRVLKCAVNTAYGTRWGRNAETICQTTGATSIVSMATGVPNFTTNTGARIGYVDKCTPYDYTLVMTNGGAGNPVAATMYDVKVIQDQYGSGVLTGIDTNLFTLSNLRVGSTSIPSSRIVWTPSPLVLRINLNDLFTTDPDGAGGLSDVDGDGFYDDLLAGNTFTITTTKTYKCNLACGYDKIHQYNSALIEYHQMCDRTTYVSSAKLSSGGDYLYEASFVGTAYLPANIFGGTPFRLTVKEGHYINSSAHDNSNTRYRWKIAMPAGLAPTGTPNPRYGLATTTYTTISGGGSGVDTLEIISPSTSLDSFSINMVFTCGAGGTLTIPYTLQKIDNISTGCSCQGDLICGSVSSTLFCPAPCPAGPTNYIPQVRRADSSLGWTDYTMATRQVATAISNYDLSKALYLDTLQIIASALQNNTANNLHIELTLNKTTGGISKLTPIGVVSRFYRSGSLVGTYTSTSFTTTGSTGSVQVVGFDVSAGVTALPLGTLVANDSIRSIVTYVVATNAGLPLNDVQQGGRHIYFNINGTGGRDYCFDPVPEMYLVGTILQNAHNGYIATGCTPVALGGSTNYLARRFNTAGVLFVNEFRPVMYVDSVVATIPTGYEYVLAQYQPQTGGSAFTITPTITGNVYRYTNPGPGAGFWQPLGLTVTNAYGGYIPFTVVPTCATVNNELTNFKVYIRDYYYAYAGLPTPPGLAYEISVPSTGAGKSVAISYSTANKPDITLNDQTGTVQGVKVNQSWTLRIANTGLTTAPYNWIAVPTSANITVTQVTDIVGSTVIPSIPYAGGNWYQLSTTGVASGGFRDYKIDFTYSDCNLDSIKLLGGWNCASYPADPTAYVCGMDSIYLKVDPKPSQVQLLVNRQPGGATGATTGIPMCATDSALIVVQSSQAADLVSPYLTFTPPTGITLGSPIKVEYPLGSGNYQNTTVTSLGGGVYKIDLTSHTGIGTAGILGTTSANPGTYPAGQDRQAKVKIDFTTDCAFTSGTSFSFNAFGKQPCGDDATGNGIAVSTDPLNITGATGGGGAGVSLGFGGTSSITCGTPITLSLTATPTTLPSQAGDTMVYTLPAGMSYAGSFVTGANCATCTITSAAGPSGTTIVKVKLETGVPASSTMLYSFNVANAGAGCGSVNVTGQYKRDVTGLLCGITPCGTTTTYLASGTSPNVTLNKPLLNITNIIVLDTTAWRQANWNANHIKVYYNNISGNQAYTANTDTIEFFCNSTATVPFAKRPLTKTIAVGASDSDEYFIMMPIGACSLGDVITSRIQTTTAAGTPQCLCSSASFVMAGVGLPLKFLSTSASASGCGVAINWSYSQSEPLSKFIIERSADGRDYKQLATLNNTDKSYFDITPTAASWLYRIKAVGVNGDVAYSSAISVITSQCANDKIFIYPNPVTDMFTIATSDAAIMSEVKIVDNVGRTIQTLTNVASGTQVNMHQLPSGFYIIKIKDKNGDMQMMKLTKK